MPRQTPLSRSSSTKTPPVIFRNPHSSVAPPTTHVPAPSFGQSIKDGFGLGFGSAVAQRVVGGIFGAPTVNVVNKAEGKTQTPCEKELLAFETCIKTQSADTFCGVEQTALVQCIQISGPISQPRQ